MLSANNIIRCKMGRKHAVIENSPLSAFSHTFTVHQECMNLTDFKHMLLNVFSNKNKISDTVKYICPMPNCDKLFLIKEELQFHMDCCHKSVDENDLLCTEVPDMLENEEEILPTFEMIHKKKAKKFTRLQEVAIQVYGELDMERRCILSKKKFVPFESGCLNIFKDKENYTLKESSNKKYSQNTSPKRKINDTISSDLLLAFQKRKSKCPKLIDINKTKKSDILSMSSILEKNEYLNDMIKYQYLVDQKLPYIINFTDLTFKNCTLPGLYSKDKYSTSTVKLLKSNGIKQDILTKQNIKEHEIIELRKSLKNQDDLNKLFGINVKLSRTRYCDQVFKIASNFILKLSSSPEKIFNPNDNFRIII
ncbi:Zinc finger, C2H2 domain-containing protein [Strongyloides ratti]|uniref:Zinc finger, C2H2 domain-containing protein n=1 Tax=Strongyloides ratti TaxID=34506 RepID=A0A090L2Y2_STRRB|nr:Zinc finger, C2H2 domain-containing protein [Strongyloides ratti]CEF64161.1 Zinc finger, C2H2 domain-containing protein [Strongyloides ratti]